jgi:hypothetical protein
MKYLRIMIAFLIAFSLVLSCKKTKEITPEEFLKMEDEVNTTDRKPQTIENIAKKYGFTLLQYTKYEEKVNSDVKLKEQLGSIRLRLKQPKEDLKK